MKGDFSRDSFEASKHFLRVLMQQGRVQLDADWNEQVAILLHYMQTLAKDIIGPFGGPRNGFRISTSVDSLGNIIDLGIHEGRYYVDGILCENEIRIGPDGNPLHMTYFTQSDYSLDPQQDPLPDLPFLVYLDVWERHLTFVEDPGMHEQALGKADTTTRSKTIWQVRTHELEDGSMNCDRMNPGWDALIEEWQPKNLGMLKARTKPSSKPETAPCNIAPGSRYRGLENQLYRVEIHSSGIAGTDKPTFKWSRENGSIIFPVTAIAASREETTVTLAHLGRDSRFSLAQGDWVELMDDKYVLHAEAKPLLKVLAVDTAELQVRLEGATSLVFDEDQHPLLRRWDHKESNPTVRGGVTLEDDGAILIQEGSGDTAWFNLEDGIQIQFQPAPQPTPAPPQLVKHFYRTGDYWLIPARTQTGDIEWPTQETAEGELVPTAQAPNGVEHHYAPLAVVSMSTGTVKIDDCRTPIESMEQPVREHVVLELVGGLTGGCGPALYDFVRVLPDGNSESSASGLGYRVPLGKVLVVTDVDWQYVHPNHGSAAETIQTLRLSIENLADPSISSRAFESTITLSSQGEGGISESMTSGFVVSSEARICPDVFPGPQGPPFGLQHLILRGYLASAN